jgi:uncharacterized membrane protein (UPF0127 family)
VTAPRRRRRSTTAPFTRTFENGVISVRRLPVLKLNAVSWLVRDGSVLAAAEVAEGFRSRCRGLLGRDHVEGALVLHRCRNVHTLGMRFPIDVAFCDAAGTVLRTCTLGPWRVSPFVLRSALVIEAEAGAFERWTLQVGDRVELRG